mgnify:CR=1 FL=1
MVESSGPDQPGLAVQIHETHSGVVVLIGDRAYKAKKPVTTEFLDFASPASRERVCAREVELNSRLAPDSYLGIAHLSDPAGGPPEPVIVMRRHPDSARLASRVRTGQPVTDCLHAVADTLAEFHDRADRGPAIDAAGSVAAVRGRWQANLTEIAALATAGHADELPEVGRLVERYLAGRSALFDARIAAGRIVDGHGDLLADDIFCLPDGVAILDCLEFDDTLRYVDVADDVAFLAMDLEFLDRPDLAEVFIDRYRGRSGDSAPASLHSFYVAYRASVRAKTDWVRFGQGTRDSLSAAQRHLRIVAERMRAATVRLALVGGGPGTGKTTVSRRVAELVGAQVISTDDVRRQLQDDGVIGGAVGTLDAGLYAPQHVDAVYRAVFDRARRLLAGGESVILDGTWRDPGRRSQARTLAAACHAPILEVQCLTAVGTAAQRVGGRPAGHPSDATPQLAQQLAVSAADWPEAHRLDTGRPPAASAAEVAQWWHRLAEATG